MINSILKKMEDEYNFVQLYILYKHKYDPDNPDNSKNVLYTVSKNKDIELINFIINLGVSPIPAIEGAAEINDISLMIYILVKYHRYANGSDLYITLLKSISNNNCMIISYILRNYHIPVTDMINIYLYAKQLGNYQISNLIEKYFRDIHYQELQIQETLLKQLVVVNPITM
jgi:hypothetical protein